LQRLHFGLALINPRPQQMLLLQSMIEAVLIKLKVVGRQRGTDVGNRREIGRAPGEQSLARLLLQQQVARVNLERREVGNLPSPRVATSTRVTTQLLHG
jgi:hypothetical protein